MYDELVERLHKRIALATAGSPLQDDLREAADAIEEMQKCLDGVCADNDSLCKQLDELSKARDAACWGCKCKKMEPQKEK